MPLDDDEVFVSKNNLKINNKNSVGVPGSAKKAFEQKANDAFKADEAFKKQAYTLGKAFVQIIEDKTLAANKSPMSKDIERESIHSLIALGIDMNADEDQPESMGSIGIITLLLKAVIMQRDRINELEYKMTRAREPHSKIESRVDVKEAVKE